MRSALLFNAHYTFPLSNALRLIFTKVSRDLRLEKYGLMFFYLMRTY